MKVSVVVPVYNTGAYLVECLQSLAEQTLDELEIIIVDDGSTDGSSTTIDDFARRHSTRMRAYTKPNGGLSDARNFGLARCCGDYVGFVDSDDFVAPSMFAELHAEAIRQDADIATCSITHVYERRRRCRYFPAGVTFGRSIVESPGILLVAGSYACNKIYRRSLFLAQSFRFPVGQQFEDSAVVYNIMLDANRIAAVNVPFYQYRRQRKGSITSAPDARIFDVFKSCQSILQHFRIHPDYGSLEPYAASLCVRHILARVRALWNSSDRRLAMMFAAEAMAFMDRELGDWKSSEYFTRRGRNRIDALLQNLLMTGPGMRFFLAVPLPWRNVARRGLRRTRTFAKWVLRTVRGRKPIVAGAGVAIGPVLGRIAAIGRSLDEKDIVNFLDSRTLLGLARHGRLTAHDRRIHLGILGNHHDLLRQVMLEHELRIRRQCLIEGRVAKESYRGDTIEVDVAYYAARADSCSAWVFYRKPGATYLNHQRDVVKMRYRPIGAVIARDVDGLRFNVPANAEALLTQRYGVDWRRPDPSRRPWQSPAAIPVDIMGHFIQFEHSTREAWAPRSRIRK